MEVAANWLERNLPDARPRQRRPRRLPQRQLPLRRGHRGEVTGWLDWERGHLGDRHRDLAWSTQPICGHYAEDGVTYLVCGLVPLESFYAEYERVSGLSRRPERLLLVPRSSTRTRSSRRRWGPPTASCGSARPTRTCCLARVEGVWPTCSPPSSRRCSRRCSDGPLRQRSAGHDQGAGGGRRAGASIPADPQAVRAAAAGDRLARLPAPAARPPARPRALRPAPPPRRWRTPWPRTGRACGDTIAAATAVYGRGRTRARPSCAGAAAALAAALRTVVRDVADADDGGPPPHRAADPRRDARADRGRSGLASAAGLRSGPRAARCRSKRHFAPRARSRERSRRGAREMTHEGQE